MSKLDFIVSFQSNFSVFMLFVVCLEDLGTWSLPNKALASEAVIKLGEFDRVE